MVHLDKHIPLHHCIIFKKIPWAAFLILEIEFPIFFRVFVEEFQSFKTQPHQWGEHWRRYRRNFVENGKELNLNACCRVFFYQLSEKNWNLIALQVPSSKQLSSCEIPPKIRIFCVELKHQQIKAVTYLPPGMSKKDQVIKHTKRKMGLCSSCIPKTQKKMTDSLSEVFNHLSRSTYK